MHQINRRQFARGIASAALVATALRSDASPALESGSAPFPLSVMLWTVFNDLPFEQRLAKIAEAGYTNVELVGEYAKWSESDFDLQSGLQRLSGWCCDPLDPRQGPDLLG